MFRFETLDIWRLANTLSSSIYRVTKSWPESESFGLTSQIRRSALSIAANIAEGSAATTIKDYKHFLDHSRKSLFETVSHVLIARQEGYLSEDAKQKLYQEADILSRKIVAFKNSLH